MDVCYSLQNDTKSKTFNCQSIEYYTWVEKVLNGESKELTAQGEEKVSTAEPSRAKAQKE
jgi:hypothetical protein